MWEGKICCLKTASEGFWRVQVQTFDNCITRQQVTVNNLSLSRLLPPILSLLSLFYFIILPSLSFSAGYSCLCGYWSVADGGVLPTTCPPPLPLTHECASSSNGLWASWSEINVFWGGVVLPRQSTTLEVSHKETGLSKYSLYVPSTHWHALVSESRDTSLV